jgi:orotate phosphoribosyltransferase
MTTFLDLAQARRGHFRMESGLHCGLWFDLDAAFVDQTALDPFVTQLAQYLRRHQIEAVCGPLTGGALLAQLLAPASRQRVLLHVAGAVRRQRGL